MNPRELFDALCELGPEKMIEFADVVMNLRDIRETPWRVQKLYGKFQELSHEDRQTFADLLSEHGRKFKKTPEKKVEKPVANPPEPVEAPSEDRPVWREGLSFAYWALVIFMLLFAWIYYWGQSQKWDSRCTTWFCANGKSVHPK